MSRTTIKQVLQPLCTRLTSLYSPYHMLFAGVLGGLLTLWITAMLYYQQANTHFIHAIDSYGYSMTGMAARQAVDATLNHDRISLQVILEDIVKQQAVISATIHDVENNLLVQAGTAPSTKIEIANSRQYHAPISLHNSLAGHVTLIIEIDPTAQQQTHWTFLLLASALLASLAGVCWYRGQYATADYDTTDSAPHESNSNKEELEPCEKNHLPEILLTLYLTNSDTLYRQLNGEARKARLEQLQQQIQHTLALYTGALIYSGTERIVIGFYGEDNDAALQAACCSYLIQQLNQQHSDITLHIKAHIQPIANIESLIVIQQFEWQRLNVHQQADMTIASTLLTDSFLKERLIINQQADCSAITGFNTNYNELLHNQLKRLIDE